MNHVQDKLASLRKTGKLLKTLSTIASLLVVVVLVLYLLLPAGNLYLEGSNSKYGRVSGYNYYGWQLTVFGYGYPPVPALAMLENPTLLAGDFIPTSFDFYPNPTLIVAVALPIVALMVLGIVARFMKNRGKAVCEWLASGVLVYSAVTLMRCVSLAIPMAANVGSTPFRNTFLLPAVNAGTFTTREFPIIIGIALIVFALLKAFRGAFLIYQRNYALKNKQ